MDLAQTPALIVHPHALVGAGTVYETAAFLRKETLGAYIERLGVDVPEGSVWVWHNGYPVPQDLWRRLIPRTGDQIVIRARVLGGGDGGKVLRTVAMVALVIAAVTIPGAGIAGLYSGFGLTGTALSLASAGIMIGGTLLINALLPPPKPTVPELSTGGKYETSPTYSISGGRNRLRQWEPMTLVFGRHRIVPDWGAQPYTVQAGDDQYFNQIFHFGLQAGSIDLYDFRIGKTPIENYQGIQLQRSGADGYLSMFAGNVDTIQGAVLQSGEVYGRTTNKDVTYLSVELVATLFYFRDDGGIDGRTSQLRIRYRPVGGAWQEVGVLSDAIYATHYWSLQWEQGGDITGYGATQTQYTYGSTNPADHYDGEQVLIDPGDGWYTPPTYGVWRWVPHPYQLGQPWYGVAPDPQIAVSTSPGVRMYGARQEPTRQTVGWAVPKGRYEIQIWKESADLKGSRESNETAVSQILAYQTDEANYAGQQRLALSIKATAQLNGAVDEFNAMAQVYCPAWDGSSWVWAATSNPAWSFLWFARGRVNAQGRRLYGACLPDSEIDIEAIKAWGLWCDQMRLTFDYVLDRKMSQGQVLALIARAGRASPTWQTGKLGVVWDAANLPHVAMFGPFNIRAGSFKIDYISDGSADEIVLNFANEERDYDMDEVRVPIPGAVTTNNPLQLDLEGCTRRDQAGREANLLAASQIWHRRRVSWETDIEGALAGRGSVVQISHDLTVWGYSGRLMHRSGQNLTLSQIVPTGAGIMMLRDPDGNMRVINVTVGLDTDTVTITSDMTGFALPGDPGYDDVPALDWAWFLDPVATPGRRFKIVEVQPQDDSIKFSAIDDDPGYYASESNPYLYAPPRDGALLAGTILGVAFSESVVSVSSDLHNVTVRWTASSTGLAVDVIVYVNGLVRAATSTTDRSVTVSAQTDDVVSVAITPKSLTASGRPFTQAYTVTGLRMPLPAVQGMTNVFRDGLTTLIWDRVEDIRAIRYEVRMGASWSNSQVMGVTTMPEFLIGANGLYWVAARYDFKGTALYGVPDSLSIAGATLVRNVLVTHVEDPAWSGAMHQMTVASGDILTLAGSGDILAEPDVLAIPDVILQLFPDGTYTSSQTVDLGYVAPMRFVMELSAYAINYNEDMLAVPDILAEADVLNESNARFWKVQPQYRLADDSGVYGDWHNHTPQEITARYVQARLAVWSDDPKIVPYIEHFSWTVDVPDMIQSGEQVSIPSGGVRITYSQEFHATPNVQIATFDAVSGDRYVLSNSDETGFDIELLNGSSAKSGVINWISQGF